MVRKMPKKAPKWTDAKDDKADKKAKVKEGSVKDKALDKKRGVGPEDDKKKVARKARR